MIDPKQLLADLQKLLKRLEPDIRARCESNRDIDAQLRGEYGRAKAADRTAQAFEVWREDYITQVAVAWILGCVFVRFLEDNHLIDTAWLAGPKDRLQLARDQHTLYFQANPTHSDREYLEHVFHEVAKLPSMHDLLGGAHNPISKLGPTGDGAHELLASWQRVDPSTGAIVYDFTDREWDTRFLGDLYQDLSESARERFALLQTPEFVEEFILDRTLSPAIEEFGYSTVKMIDPACGSGHFLLGGFRRLLDLRSRHEPAVALRAQVEDTLAQVFGVDVNPFAAAIARFRLLIYAHGVPDSKLLEESRLKAEEHHEAMVALQEELDWKSYQIFGITQQGLTCTEGVIPGIRFGERAFEFVMARRMDVGDIEGNWFDRHSVTPRLELPAHWSTEYRQVVEKRMALIENDEKVQLLEQPEYKRRWVTKPWSGQHADALREWLLDRIEHSDVWQEARLISCAYLADRLREDVLFAEVAGRFRARPDFEWSALVVELLEPDATPLLTSLRFTPSGLQKRGVWERVWDLQRAEDRIQVAVQSDDDIPEFAKADQLAERKRTEVGPIPPPPHYDTGDYQRPTYWQLRGKLDLPKERFITFPFCGRDADPTPVIGWAGWDHLQQAQAIAAYYERVKNYEGWVPHRRVPLLTGIVELLPWLKQWHNDIHPVYQERMGDFFQQFVEDEARTMEVTLDEIRGWTPPAQSGARGRRRRNT